MPRIVLLSDTHGLHDEMAPVPDGDILIHAGDLTRSGSLAEISNLTAFFASLPHKHKVVIAGNHDFCFEKDKVQAAKLLPGTIYLQDKLTELMGLKIYGSPWQPRFGDWAFNLDRGTPLRSVWSRIPDKTDILVTHGPPYSIHDLTELEKQHVGCKDLLVAVQRVKPKLHVFGHIHCSYGQSVKDGTTYVNAAICDERYQPVNLPIVIDL